MYHRLRGYNVFVPAWDNPLLIHGFVLIDSNILRERLSMSKFIENQQQTKHFLHVAKIYDIPIFDSFEAGIKQV